MSHLNHAFVCFGVCVYVFLKEIVEVGDTLFLQSVAFPVFKQTLFSLKSDFLGKSQRILVLDALLLGTGCNPDV